MLTILTSSLFWVSEWTIGPSPGRSGGRELGVRGCCFTGLQSRDKRDSLLAEFDVNCPNL